MKKQELEIQRLIQGRVTAAKDETAIELRFQIQIPGKEAFELSCTPEDLEELVTGALFSKGYITQAAQVKEIEIFPKSGEIKVSLEKNPQKRGEREREKDWETEPEKLLSLADAIFEKPGKLFADTGCAHCCTMTLENEILWSYEDIGRHNALDKVIGKGLKQEIDFSRAVIFTTGRISGDYMKKIIKAGIRCVVSRSAVTTEAVSLAREQGVHMYGFVRGGKGNIYS